MLPIKPQKPLRPRKYNPNQSPPWVKKAAGMIHQFIIPFTIFQGVRTLIFPTFLDFLLLALFIFIAYTMYY